MEFLENFITVLDYILSTNRKRITGGILLSLSALFGGLAVTAITITTRKEDNDG